MEQKHEIASDYLIKFSKLIRLILDNSRSETISIEKELETLKLYVILESARYDNKFKCIYTHCRRCKYQFNHDPTYAFAAFC